MSNLPTPKAPSPFAARASARAPLPTAGAKDLGSPSKADNPKRTGGGGNRASLLRLAGIAAATLLGGGIWWSATRGDSVRRESPSVATPGLASANASAPTPSAPAVEATPPAVQAERLAEAFAAVQARAALLDLEPGARTIVAEASLLAAKARAQAEAGEVADALKDWRKALTDAGAVVYARVHALHESAATALRDVRLDDQAAPEAVALLRARSAAEESARRGEWADAIRAVDEAQKILPAARGAIAKQFAGMAKDATARGDAAMAGIFHQRALRLDASLGVSRDYLYRHKFAAGQIIRTPGGLDLAYAPPAEFQRGSPAGEPGRDADETFQRVTLSKGFFLAVNETTQRDWDRVMGAGAALRTLRAARAKPETISPDLPMHSVTWAQAEDYCRRLSEMEGLGFRLPTEAEWEYACRAGTDTAFNLGVDGISARDANIDDGTSLSPIGPRPPGTFGRANAWGLRDMHGNVWEWCADWSAPYPSASALRDPAGPSRDKLGRIDLAMKVVRGGGWNAPANDARSANRWEYAPDVATPYIGLRVAHDPDLTKF